MSDVLKLPENHVVFNTNFICFSSKLSKDSWIVVSQPCDCWLLLFNACLGHWSQTLHHRIIQNPTARYTQTFFSAKFSSVPNRSCARCWRHLMGAQHPIIWFRVYCHEHSPSHHQQCPVSAGALLYVIAAHWPSVFSVFFKITGPQEKTDSSEL